MIYIFYILIFLFLYPYFIYPIILFILGKFIKYEYKFDNSLEPKVSIVISVYNEEELIIDCIKSILNSNYNSKNIEIFIGSDGSSDNTNQIVKDFIKSYKNIYFYEFGRSGKNLVLNNLIKHVKTDYVFYMDADIRITKDAIKNSIIYLADNNVGLVISRMIQINSENYEPNLTLTTLKSIEAQFNTGLLGESFYQKYEHYLRLWSSNISTSVNSLGAFYLMKMSLYEPIANEKVCDDYYTVLTALVNQKKVMYNDNSIVFEVRKKQISDEMQRRIRLTAGSLSTLYIKKQILNPLFGFSSLFTWSNKLLRIISPIFFIFAVIFAYFVLKSDINIFYYKTFFEGLLILFVFSTIFDKLGSNLNINLKIFKIYRFFIIMNIGYLLGIFEFLKGKHNSKWGHNI
ncbi:MAG: glycosyltransferase [Candidatus Kapaibacteriota bacterium]